jgi:hypothetical protein
MGAKEAVMIELTEEQRRELCHPEPVVIDPQTKEEYVLVRKAVYARLRAALADDSNPGDAYPAVDRAFAPGWDDPKMDEYDRYEERRP